MFVSFTFFWLLLYMLTAHAHQHAKIYSICDDLLEAIWKYPPHQDSFLKVTLPTKNNVLSIFYFGMNYLVSKRSCWSCFHRFVIQSIRTFIEGLLCNQECAWVGRWGVGGSYHIFIDTRSSSQCQVLLQIRANGVMNWISLTSNQAVSWWLRSTLDFLNSTLLFLRSSYFRLNPPPPPPPARPSP